MFVQKNNKAEVAFDTGTITVPRTKMALPFSEIEIELKNGSLSIVSQLQKEITGMARSAKIQPLSKAAQGCSLYKKAQRA